MLSSQNDRWLNPHGVPALDLAGVVSAALRPSLSRSPLPSAENPKGIPPQSPGLPRRGQSGSDRGYPGFEASVFDNPEKVAPRLPVWFLCLLLFTFSQAAVFAAAKPSFTT